MRERKIVLIVMGDEQILDRSRFILNRLSLDYSIKFVRNYTCAYKIIVEYYVDVMVCGPATEKSHQSMVDAYQFMGAARKMVRYQKTPMILISDVEDPSCYCHQKLRCFAIIDTLAIETRLCQALDMALQTGNIDAAQLRQKLRIDKLEPRTLCIQNQNVVYPIKCARVSHILAINHTLEVYMQDGKRYFLRYFTLQQLLETAGVWYFLQCSRSGIVNVNYVKNIDYTNRMITMYNEEQVAIGPTYVKALRRQFPTVQEIWMRKKQVWKPAAEE